MTRTIRIEAPTEQNLRLYLFPYTTESPADSGGYALVETGPRQYEVEIDDIMLLGTYRGVIEAITEDITTTIDSGYITICQADDTYVMSNKAPTTCTTTPSQESVPAELPDYGPKRVKTKEMEIEQFDPMRLQMAQDRSRVQQPSWCDGAICVGNSIRP